MKKALHIASMICNILLLGLSIATLVLVLLELHSGDDSVVVDNAY